MLFFFFGIDLFSIDPGIFNEECRTRGKKKIVSLNLALQFQISTPTIAQESDLISYFSHKQGSISWNLQSSHSSSPEWTQAVSEKRTRKSLQIHGLVLSAMSVEPGIFPLSGSHRSLGYISGRPGHRQLEIGKDNSASPISWELSKVRVC
jgi:hypothetical protein